MINVNFRVTGMYFGRSSAFDNDAVILTVNENPTVEDLLRSAEKIVKDGKFPHITSFNYTEKIGGGIDSITIKYNKKIKDGREAGTYTMKDQNVGENIEKPNQNLVLQYYIYDENFRQLNNNNATALFNQKPDVEIKDKYSVVIRQLVILNNSEEAVRKPV